VDEIRADRLRLLMKENRLSSAALLARLRQTAGNERVHRGTLSGVLNNKYRGTPSVVFVRGLAQTLETTTDYLLGLSDEPQPGAMAFASRYTLADEEQLLVLLAEQNKELADIMRAIRDIPEEEQIVILQHLEEEVAFVRRMAAERAAAQASSGADRPDPPANNPLYLSWDTDDDHRST
jgi:transcriptional regulator with XRE-family HTH domain